MLQSFIIASLSFMCTVVMFGIIAAVALTWAMVHTKDDPHG